MSKRTPRTITLVPQKEDRVSLSQRFGGGSDGDRSRAKLSWGAANPIELAELVATIVDAGAAVMFGVTRDGGACVVTVFDGDDKRKWYPDDARSMAAAIAQIGDAFRTPAAIQARRSAEAKIG